MSRSQQVLKVATPFRAAQLGSAPGVPRHPPQLVLADVAGEVFHHVRQLAQGLRLSTYDFVLSLRPEAEI